MSLEDLMNVTVTTASKSSESLQTAPAIMNVIPSREIEAYGAVTLSDVLDRLTSVYFMSTYFAPDGMIAMRSTQTDHYNTKVLILLDGRPLRESFHGGYNGIINSMFPVERIDRIEVIRGPGSVLYGTGAYVGVINLVTKKGNDGLTASMRYGQFNTRQGNLSYGVQKKDFSLSAGMNLLKNNGWNYEARGESDVIRNKANTADSLFKPAQSIKRDVEGISGVLKMDYKGLTISALAASNEWATMNRLPAWPTPQEYRIHNDRYFTDVTYSKQIVDKWNASISATYNSFNYRAFNPSKADDYLRRGSNDLLLEFTNHIKPAANLNVVVGGLVNKQSGKGIDTGFDKSGDAVNIDSSPNANPWETVPQYNYTWYAAYAQADYTPVKQVKLIAGAQLNKIDGLAVNYSPRFGAILSANENLGVKLLYGNAFRSPSAFERFGQSPSSVVGSTSLTPEKMRTFEAQIFYTKEKLSLASTYFNNHDADNISRQNLVQTINGVRFTQVYVNSGYTNVSGLELEGKYNLNAVIVQGSMTYQTSNDYLGQKDYTGIPKVMTKLGATYNFKNYGSLGVWNSYYAKPSDYYLRNTDGVVLTKMANPDVKAFNLMSANLVLRIKELASAPKFPNISFNVLVTNVLNSKIYYPELVRRNINSLPGRPGRSIFAGVVIKI